MKAAMAAIAAIQAARSGLLANLDPMCIHTHMNSRDVIKRLGKDGWKHFGTEGSHWHFKHPTKPGKITVPHPKKDLPRGTLKNIWRVAGIDQKV